MADKPIIVSGKGGLKVIGAGFGRTGTLSLKAALEELGFGPCYHMVEVFDKPASIAHWIAAARGKPVDWNTIFEEYQATVDWPGCAFYKELMQMYPDAKVLLTVRDPESWYESARNTIYQIRSRAAHSPIKFALLGIFFPRIRHATRLTNVLIWEGTFGGNFEDKQYAIAVFNQHIEEVKQLVPPERLLVYEVKEGWGPLCAFLGVEVPGDKPFPHLNDQADFAANRIRRKRART